MRSPLEGAIRWAYHRFHPDRYARMNAKYDRETIAVMQRCLSRESNCVDIGCLRGSILRQMLKLAPSGVHYAFEPLPSFYQRLIGSYPKVNLYELALSDVTQEALFQYVVSRPELSGLKPMRYGSDEYVEQIKVKTDLLDNIVPRHLPVRFIKVDVEGAELQVLRGAVSIIRANRPFIVFEHGVGLSDCYGTTPEDVYDLLVRDCGLRVSLMERWLKDEAPLNRAEFIDQFNRNINYYFLAYEG